jgi:hypothetical protein
VVAQRVERTKKMLQRWPVGGTLDGLSASVADSGEPVAALVAGRRFERGRAVPGREVRPR